MAEHYHDDPVECMRIAWACTRFVGTGNHVPICGDGCCHSEACATCGESWYHSPDAFPPPPPPRPGIDVPLEYEYPPGVKVGRR